MDRTGDSDDHLAIVDQTLALRIVAHEARVCELTLYLLVSREIAYILRRADVSDDERSPFGALSDGLDAHAVARRIKPREVSSDLRPVGDSTVVAGREAEHGLWRGHVRRIGARMSLLRAGERRTKNERQSKRNDERRESKRMTRHDAVICSWLFVIWLICDDAKCAARAHK